MSLANCSVLIGNSENSKHFTLANNSQYIVSVICMLRKWNDECTRTWEQINLLTRYTWKVSISKTEYNMSHLADMICMKVYFTNHLLYCLVVSLILYSNGCVHTTEITVLCVIPKTISVIFLKANEALHSVVADSTLQLAFAAATGNFWSISALKFILYIFLMSLL